MLLGSDKSRGGTTSVPPASSKNEVSSAPCVRLAPGPFVIAAAVGSGFVLLRLFLAAQKVSISLPPYSNIIFP